MSPLQRVPRMQARRFLVRKQHVTAGLSRMPLLDDYIDHIVRLDGNGTIGQLKLLNGDHTLNFVANINEHLLGGDFDDTALQQLAFRGWGQVTIVFEQMLVVVLVYRFRRARYISLVWIAGHANLLPSITATLTASGRVKRSTTCRTQTTAQRQPGRGKHR